MMVSWKIYLCCLLTAQAVSSTAASDLPPLTPEVASRVLVMLTSPDSVLSANTASSLRLRGTSEACKEQAGQLLKEARQAHLKTLEPLVRNAVPKLTLLKTDYDAWLAKCAEVLELIRTDYHKDAAKVAMLTREVEATDKLLKVVDRDIKTGESTWTPPLTALKPLMNLDHEIALLEDPASMPPVKKPEDYLMETEAAKVLLPQLELVKQRKKFLDDQAAVAKYNQICTGPAKQAVSFAALLNQNRAILNLQPLRLDQQLCAAATDHSKEMISLGYFAHESPVAANKTPWDRAKNASFGGDCSGENIFKGRPSFTEAYGGWWFSDGHRFLMFAGGPNTLGVGPVGDTWTMMTGNKNWAASSPYKSQ